MLRRSHRVSGDLFNEIMKSGKVMHSPLFLARILSKRDSSSPRIAAVVPVKVAKTSVLRHLVRRRTYEALRPLFSKMSAGNFVILFAKPPALKLKPKEMEPDIASIFVKAGILR